MRSRCRGKSKSKRRGRAGGAAVEAALVKSFEASGGGFRFVQAGGGLGIEPCGADGLVVFHSCDGGDDDFVAEGQAFERRDRWIINAKNELRLAPLRQDPRFQDLMRRIGL